jgi:Phosphatidylglycerol lysyltransferase, C-terminal
MTTPPPRHLIDRLLATVPRYPDWRPAGYDQWKEALGLIAATHRPHADLGCAAQFVWFGAHARRWSRIGPVLLIGHAGTNEVMAVLVGNAAIRWNRAWQHLLRAHDLRYVPEETAAALAAVVEREGMQLVTEVDDADYAYDLARLARLDDPELRRYAEAADHLDRRGAPIVREGRLRDPWVRQHLSIVSDRWAATRPPGRGVPEDVRTERAGLFGLPADRRTDHLRVFTLWAWDRPAAFSLVEPAWDSVWLGVVFKFDRDVKGATAYLRRAVAQRGLGELGSGTLNLAQDAGIDGLRSSKTAWGPATRVQKWRTAAAPTPGLQPWAVHRRQPGQAGTVSTSSAAAISATSTPAAGWRSAGSTASA